MSEMDGDTELHICMHTECSMTEEYDVQNAHQGVEIVVRDTNLR